MVFTRKAYLNIDPLGQRNSDVVLDAATVVHCKIVIRHGILMMNCPRFCPNDVGTKLGTGDKTWGQTKKRLNLGSRDKMGKIHFGNLAIMQKNEFVISNNRQETYWGHPAE
jgi:hypothetical protein